MYSVVLAAVLTTSGTEAPGWLIHGGCHGGCTGPVVNGYLYNSGCYGPRYGYAYGAYSSGVFGGCCGGYTACFGGAGFNASYFVPYGAYTGGIIYNTPSVPIPPPVREKKEEQRGNKELKVRPTQAVVIVQLPEDAKLIVDGNVANLTSETRTFATPDLLPDREYYYTITAELIRDGRSAKQSQKVFVRAGRTSRVDFGEMAAASARR